MDDFSQAARIGPDGLVLGPNKVGPEVNRAADQAQGTLGINNVKVGPNGIVINDGNRLNSTVQVRPPMVHGEKKWQACPLRNFRR